METNTNEMMETIVTEATVTERAPLYYCDDCEEPIYADDAYYQTYDGCIICQSCFEESYSTCDDCGRIYPSDELTTTREGGRVCESCMDNYHYCYYTFW